MIERLVAARAPGASICPSEVARALWPEGWRDHMQEVRAAALRMIDAGRIKATQRRRVVDLRKEKGLYRLSRRDERPRVH